MPLVSVIVATYNRADYVPATVAGILGQSFRDFELIVIDDGSTDDTANALEPYCKNIRYVYQENAERGAARNHGLRLATGKYIAFVDSDDIWLPRKLEAEVQRLRSDPQLGLVYSAARVIDASGRPLGRLRRRPREGSVLEHIVCENFITFSAHLLDRERFSAVGAFSEDLALSGSEDWEAWVRLAAQAPFAYVPNEGVLYRVHPQASSAQPERMEQSLLQAHTLIFANPELNPLIAHLQRRARAVAHLVLASYYYAGQRNAEVRRHLREARMSDSSSLLDRRYWGMLLRLALGRRVLDGLRWSKHRLLERTAGSRSS